MDENVYDDKNDERDRTQMNMKRENFRRYIELYSTYKI